MEDGRLRFVARRLDGETMTALCPEFGISRKTGYKVYDRYKQVGVQGLTDRSRRPYRHANQLPLVIEKTIMRLKRDGNMNSPSSPNSSLLGSLVEYSLLGGSCTQFWRLIPLIPRSTIRCRNDGIATMVHGANLKELWVRSTHTLGSSTPT